MGYSTDFEGAILIKPPLPDHYVEEFNTVAKKRNNTYQDGDAGSFDHIYHGFMGKQGSGRSFTAVPGCWCQWRLVQYLPFMEEADAQPCTAIKWDGGEKFYSYVEWLEYVVERIKADFPDSRFSGIITWKGEDSSDLGQIKISKRGSVAAKLGRVVYS